MTHFFFFLHVGQPKKKKSRFLYLRREKKIWIKGLDFDDGAMYVLNLPVGSEGKFFLIIFFINFIFLLDLSFPLLYI